MRESPTRRRSPWDVAVRFAFVVLAVAGLLCLLDHTGWDRITEHLARVGWAGAALLLLLGVLEALVDAEAFRAALPVPVSRFYIYVANQTGALINRFIPMETGEVVKGALLSRRAPTGDAVVGTVIWNYLFKLAKPMAAVISLSAALLFGDASLRNVALWMIPATVLAFLPWAAMKLLIAVGLGGLFIRVVRLLHVPVKDPDALVAHAREVDRVVRQFRHERPAAWRAVLAWQIVGRIFSWVSYWITMVLLDQTYDLATVGMIWTGFMVMGYLVAVLPSRLGTTEVGGYVLFDILGLDPATGLTTQVILSLRAIAVNGLSALCLVFLDTSVRAAAKARGEAAAPGAAPTEPPAGT